MASPIDIDAQAREYADRIAPRPKWDPVHAGFIGAAVFGFPVALFAGLARFNLDAAPWAFAITIAIGFLCPFGYLKHQERENTRAFVREYMALREQNERDG